MSDSLRELLQSALGPAYTVERELTGAGMSRVFVARDTALDRRVVIKTLSPELAAVVNVERFRREIRVAASLQQANIVPVHSAGDINGVPYYIMPFVEGESLGARLSTEGALPIPEAIRILRDIARALCFAHERGVVHRDIKPENVLLSGTTAVVTDFGIAKAIDASRAGPDASTLTGLGTALGTPAYIAPEQASGDPLIDHRADIYALGVLAYELLAGTPPFVARSAQRLIAAHISEQPADVAGRRPALPRQLAVLVMRCLEKDPALRPQSAHEVLETLDALSLRPVPEMEPPTAPRSATPPAVSVAVLPFTNMSSNADDEYFSDGMTEDITTHLSQLRSLRVISRTSASRYRKTEKNTREIAAELNVSHIVEGSVRRAANRLRIVAQLIEAGTDAHLWAETFDRDLTDVFAIQSDVAERVADVLRARLSPDERARFAKRPTDDVEAYNLFLLGRHHYNSVAVGTHPDALARAAGYFQRAIDRDPGFANAYAWLALVHSYYGGGYWHERPREAWARALPLATRALGLDAEGAEAHLVLGQHADWILFDWAAARMHKKRALQLNPNDAFVCVTYGMLLAACGHGEEVVATARHAVQLDPASPLIRYNAIWLCWSVRRYDDAVAELRAARASYADLGLLSLFEALVFVALGRYSEALRSLAELTSRHLDTWGNLMVTTLLAACGKHAEARSRLSALHERETNEYVWPPGFAMCYGYLDELDRAFEYLDRGYEDRAGWMSLLATLPTFDPLRSDPRFDRLLELVAPPAASMR